jgi:D-sedoheptulose 7-phosphate isomerase
MTSEALVKHLRASRDALDTTSKWDGLRRVDDAVFMITSVISEGKPLLVCGNGGSASDAMHITAELVGRFLKERKAINCICLSSDVAVLTAWANDYSYSSVFARQVEAHGTGGGALLGISTSGNSENVVRAFETARSIGVKTVGLTGEGGGKLAPLSDVLIDVPAKVTALVQQLHMCIYHYICERIESYVVNSAR